MSDSYAIKHCAECGRPHIKGRYGKSLPTDSDICDNCWNKKRENDSISNPEFLTGFKKQKIKTSLPT